MKTLTESINDYLIMRRGLGFKLVKTTRLLHNFAVFMEAQGASSVTTKMALQWATQPANVHPSCWASRLTAVRGFARHHQATDPSTEVPEWRLLACRPRRARPYLYSEQEVERLMQAAKVLAPSTSLRGSTYYCLLGLLAVTGLRISEALALKRDDVDLQQGLLTIRGAKFGKSRLVPLHATTRDALSHYSERRDLYFNRQTVSNFFVSKRGRALKAGTVRLTFRNLSRQVGLRGQMARTGPRLHDFRHRLAIATLLRWYRSGDDVERRLPVLSTFLGHAHVGNTYWYLSACPELMGEAARRLQQRWDKPS
jgi:integrase/recombinase XerD